MTGYIVICVRPTGNKGRVQLIYCSKKKGRGFSTFWGYHKLTVSGLFLFRCFVFQRPTCSTPLNALSRHFLSPGVGASRGQQRAGAVRVGVVTDRVVVQVQLQHHEAGGGQAGVLLLQFIQLRNVAQCL